MQENIEIRKQDKIKLKVISAQKERHMKDMITDEAHSLIKNNDFIPMLDREEEENRGSLIIKLDDDFKGKIKDYCSTNHVRIRDFWVECINRIIRKYENED